MTMESIASRVAHFTKMMGTRTPIVQAPMAGVGTPRLVAASSNAGALGSHAVAFRTADQVVADFKAIRDQTSNPISCNVFAIPTMELSRDDGSMQEFEETTRALKPEYDRLGISMPNASDVKLNESHDDQLWALLDSGVKVQSVSFTMGILSPEWMDRLHAAGILVVGKISRVGFGFKLGLLR
jgi:nitronate monooxygenase